jgi:nicotinamide mononucleotide transporter
LSRVIALCLLLAAALYLLLTWARGSVPVLDALIAALSLAAQWLLNRRKLEHWYFWITVDVISIPVYAYKELYLVALLYAVYLVLCIGGLRAWRRALADGR